MQNFVANGWKPAPHQGPRLAQQTILAPTTTSPGMTAPPPFIDSALVATAVDGLGAVSTGILAYGASTVKSKWAWGFGIISGILAFKGLIDLSRIRQR